MKPELSTSRFSPAEDLRPLRHLLCSPAEPMMRIVLVAASDGSLNIQNGVEDWMASHRFGYEEVFVSSLLWNSFWPGQPSPPSQSVSQPDALD